MRPRCQTTSQAGPATNASRAHRGQTTAQVRDDVRLAAALKGLGHAPRAVYPDTDPAVLVVGRPDPFGDFTRQVAAVPEAGVPEPVGESAPTDRKKNGRGE